jgi:hypothetical protein
LRVTVFCFQGVPLALVEELLTEAVEDCIKEIQAITVPVVLSAPSPTEHLEHVLQSSCFQLIEASKAIPSQNFHLDKIWVGEQVRHGQHSISNATNQMVTPTTQRLWKHEGEKMTVSDLNGYLKTLGSAKQVTASNTILHKLSRNSRHLQTSTPNGKVDSVKPAVNMKEIDEKRSLSVSHGLFPSAGCARVLPPAHTTCKRSGKRRVVLPEEAQTLSHGCEEMMEFARQAMVQQLQTDKKSG